MSWARILTPRLVFVKQYFVVPPQTHQPLSPTAPLNRPLPYYSDSYSLSLHTTNMIPLDPMRAAQRIKLQYLYFGQLNSFLIIAGQISLYCYTAPLPHSLCQNWDINHFIGRTSLFHVDRSLCSVLSVTVS